MATTKDFVEEWIEMRSKLKRQLELIETGQIGAGEQVIGSTTESTRARLKKWVDELNELLKESARADRA